MAQSRDASGRFTKGGTQLGSAYGQVVIDSSGVKRGVSSAVGALNGMTRSLGGVITKMGVGLVGAGVAGVAAITGVAVSGVKMAAQLEAKMSDVKAVMQITTQEVAMLEDHILDLGVDPGLKVSAMEAASAVEMLGRNGLSTKQILDGAARSSILLANATSGEMAQSADLVTDVLALFNIEASQMETAVDGITSVVNNSKFNITDYQYALAQAGGTASTAGVSFQDLNTVIAAISPAFADGSSAGAAFKMMLQRMANPTGEMAQVMRELNLMTADGKNLFYDEAGQMKDMSEVSRMLNQSLAGLTEQQRTQAMTIMFGARSINAASQLMKYGATVTITAAEAMDIFGVSQEEANAMVERGITEFEMLDRAMQDTKAAAAVAARMDNLSGSIEIMMGVIETLRIRIGKVFKDDVRDAVSSITGFLADNADRIVGFFAVVHAVFKGFFATIKSFFGGLASAFNKNFSGINQQSGSWGKNIIISLARGMAQAATAVVQVLNRIGQIISHWLKPGSPPKLLPDIDDWGTGTIDAWLSGFNSADFSVFDELSGTIEQYMRAMAPEDDMGLIPRILGSRGEIAAIIDQIRETGSVGEDVFARLQEVTGPLPQSVLDYAVALLEMEAAQTAVNNASKLFSDIQHGNLDALEQNGEIAALYGGEMASSVQAYTAALQRLRVAKEAVSAAQTELNAVESEYDAILTPLNRQLKEMQDQKDLLKDKEKLAELDEIIAQAAADGGEATEAIAERDELLLRMKIKATEQERDTAVDAAKDKLDAAKEGAATAEQLAEEQRQRAMELAQVQVDAANASLAAVQEQLAASKALFDAQQENNALMREQMDLLADIGEALAGVGDALSELGGSDSILGDLGDGLSGIGAGLGDGISESIDTATEDVVSSIDQMVADIEAEFQPLIDAGGQLGETWGGVFGELASRMTTIKEAVATKLKPLSDWFNENKGPMAAFGQETFGPVGESLMELGQNIATFVQEQGAKLTSWYQDNEPLIRDFMVVLGVLAVAFIRLSNKGKIMLIELWQVVEPLLNGMVDLFLGAAKYFMQIATGDWAGAFETAKQNVLNAWVAIQASFTGFLNWVTGWFGSDWETVMATWDNNWQMLKDIVGTVWENIKTSVATFFTEIGVSIASSFLNFVTTWETNWEMLKGIVSTVWENIKTSVATFFTEIGTSVAESFLTFVTTWETNWETIKETVATKIEELKTAALEKLRGWFAAMGLDFDEMREKWAQIFDDIELIVLTVLTRVGSIVDEKITLVKTFLYTKFEEIKLWWTGVWASIFTTISTKLEEILTKTTEKTTSIKTVVEEKIAAAKLFIEEKIAELQEWWATHWGEIQAKIEEILALITTAVGTKILEVYTLITDKIAELQEWWTTHWEEIQTKIEEIWTAIVTAVGEKIIEVYDAITSKIEEIQTWVEGKVSTFHDMGANLINGMKDGVMSAVGGLISSVTQAIEDAIAAAKAALGIQSPSKVFGSFGENSIMSFANRFQGKAKKAAGMVRDAMKPSIDAASRYASMTAVSQRPLAMAGAAYQNSSPASVTVQSKPSENYHFYAPITIKAESDKAGVDILSQLKALTGRNS